MSLGDHFPESFKSEFAKNNIDIGNAILIKIDSFEVDYDKYVVVVSENIADNVLACVIINSIVNENVFYTENLKRLNIKVEQKDHDFLDHNSYVDCSKIKRFSTEYVVEYLKRDPSRAVGNVTDNLLRHIHFILSTAKTISRKEKDYFGF